MNKGEAVPGRRSAKKFSALFLSSFFFPPLLFAFTLSGQIMEKGAKTPLPGAALYLEAAGDTLAGSQPSTILSAPTPAPSYSAESDAKGRYQCALPAGKYRLAVAAEGYEKLEMPLLEIRGNQTQDFYLKREGFTLPEVVVSAEKAPKSQVSQETLSPEELTSVAGSVGDVMRAVQSLPGVINAGVEYDGLLVRGSGPDDNLYLVDRIPIGFPFHFGGAISTLDSSLLQGLDFITGNPGPAYANAQGGVVDVAQRDPRTDRWGFRADLNLLMSEAEVEGPLAPGWSVVFAGRRSYLDLLIGSLNSSTFTAVPVFEDYQVKAAYNPSPTRHWDFEAMGSDDRVGVNVNGDAAAQDPALGGDFNFEDAYHSQGINYRDTTDPQNAFWNTLYHTQSWFDQSFGGGLYLDSTLEDFGDWFSWRHDFDKGAQLRRACSTTT